MTEFKVGDRVNVTIENARVIAEGYDDRYESPFLRLALPINGGEGRGRIHLDAIGVTVTRATPENWPPQAGDLWREVDGALWFAQSLGGSQMALIPARMRGSLDSSLPAYVEEVFGPLALVHREERP